MSGFLASLSGLTFINPWILAGLAALPVLWFLLRVIPPSPKIVRLPTVRFMAGLNPSDRVSAHTPWWILLLRLIIAALVLLALARPVLNPADSLNQSGIIRIVMDNGWAAAQTWTAQQTAAEQILDRAARDRLPVIVMTTAPDPGKVRIGMLGPMPAGEARNMVRGLHTRPWPADYTAVANAVRDGTKTKDAIHTYWIGHGLNDGTPASATHLARTLQSNGSLTYLEPEAAARPVLLVSHLKPGQDLSVAISTAAGTPAGLPLAVDALGNDGRVLERVDTLTGDKTTTDVTIKIPESLRSQVARIHLSGRHGAGGLILLDDQFERRMVGLATTKDEGTRAPLTDAPYYLTRAIEPYVELKTGSIDDLIKSGPSVIILPDVGAIPPDTLNALENWVKAGGLLLRFAGPNMTQGESFLTPAPLMRGGRAMDGGLTWDKPQTLAPFGDESPFYGLDLPADIEVRRQILSAPGTSDAVRVWAALTDGTPLVTASSLDNGLLVMVHTTASPEWSNLALSGLYVQMLRRIIALAGTPITNTHADGTLEPLQILDGDGRLQAPDSTAEPIDARAFAKQMPDSRHPPGYYGHAGAKRALNIGERIRAVAAMPSLPNGVVRGTFTGGTETDLMPTLLATALMLFLADWIIMMILQSPLMIGLSRMARSGGTAIIVLGLSFTTLPAHAQTAQTQTAMDFANGTWLAHVRSGDPTLDAVARKGLENMDFVLTNRTSIEPAGVVMVDPEKDDLAFFPLLYWPIAPSAPPVSDKALKAIQYYLDHGGIILFDTRDQGATVALPAGVPGRNQIILRNMVAGLNVPPLSIAPDDHVLKRSFYLLDSFPGRYDSKNLWVEEQTAIGRDGVSSVIVGGNDWAAMWAEGDPERPTMSQEMSYRFGVNLMMYALTGNYKADQVHLPHILERLGQ